MRLLILLVFVFAIGCHTTTETPVTKQNNPASLDLPSTIDFGTVDTGSFKDTTLDLFNVGNQTLHVLDQHFSSNAFGVDSTKFDIIGRVTHGLTFRYTPVDLNEHTATDTLVTDVKNYVVQLHAKGSVPADANDLLFAGTDQGIFLSSDRGHDWVATNAIPGAVSVKQVFTFQGNIYARTNDNIYRSPDLGNAWVAMGLPTLATASLAAFDSVVLASDQNGRVYQTTNVSSWTATNVYYPVKCFTKMPDSNRYFCAGTYAWYSTNSGLQWQRYSTPFYRMVTAIGYRDPNVFVALPSQGIFRLNETGFNEWLIDSTDAPIQSDYYCFLGTSSTIYLLSSGGLLRTPNGGFKWTLLSASNIPVNDLNSSSLLIAIHDQILLGCTSGIYRSADNGMTWTPSNSGLTNKSVNSIAILHRP